jgi:hypothetical protein
MDPRLKLDEIVKIGFHRRGGRDRGGNLLVNQQLFLCALRVLRDKISFFAKASKNSGYALGSNG